MTCPYCGDQVHSSGYFEMYHAGDGTPICDSESAARKRQRENQSRAEASHYQSQFTDSNVGDD